MLSKASNLIFFSYKIFTASWKPISCCNKLKSYFSGRNKLPNLAHGNPYWNKI